jgi:hypothetical protein
MMPIRNPRAALLSKKNLVLPTTLILKELSNPGRKPGQNPV